MDAVSIPLASGSAAIIDKCDEDTLFRLWPWSWYVGRRGYVQSGQCVGGGRQVVVKMHRLVMGFPKSSIDHANGNKLDNRRCNLRLCTNSQNQANRRSSPHSSSFKGVTVQSRTGRFEAQIWHSNKRIYLGTFVNEIEAARAYDAKAIELFGEFALLNLNK